MEHNKTKQKSLEEELRHEKETSLSISLKLEEVTEKLRINEKTKLELSEEITKLRHEIQTTRDKEESLNKEVSILKQKLSEKENECKVTIQHLNLEKENSIHSLKLDLERQVELVKTLQLSEREMSLTIKSLEDNREIFEKRVNEIYQEKLDNLNKANDSMTNELVTKINHIEKEKEQLLLKENQCSTKLAESELSISHKDENISNLNVLLSQLKARMEEFEKLKNQIALELSREKDKNKNESGIAEQECQIKISSFSERGKLLEQKNNVLQSQIQVLESDIKKLTKIIEEKLKSGEGDVGQLRKDLADKNNIIAALQSQLRVQGKIPIVEYSIKDDLEKQLAEIKAEEELLNRKKELEKQLSQLSLAKSNKLGKRHK